jgi:hypothetical protein
MLCSEADQCQRFRKTVFRIMVELQCSTEMATSKINPHSKAVHNSQFHCYHTQTSLRCTAVATAVAVAAAVAEYSKPGVG